LISITEQIMVAFTGEGAGRGPLSWGQSENWSAIVAQKTWIPLGGVKPLDPGTTLDEVAAELRYLIGRYQPMRTLLEFAADGTPTQVVYETGEFGLGIVEAGDADPAGVAEALCDQWRSSDLDFATEWPLRIALVRKDGQYTHMPVLMSHFVTDAAGAIVMMSEVTTREPAPVNGMQPLAQARWQHSPAGLRQNDGAMRYWENVLRGISPQRFHKPEAPQEPQHWHGEFSSPSMLPAVREIARRSGLESTTILLTIYAVALNQITGINPVVIRPMVSNRFRPGLASIVCTLAQAGLCVLDVAGLSFGDALERVQRAVMAAYKHAYFNHHDMVAVRDRVAADRGAEVNIACYFNDRRTPMTKQDQSPAASEPSVLRWVAAQNTPTFEPLFLHVDDATDRIQITVYLDTAYLSSANGEALVYGMEKVALDAAGPS
jgi:hypothetical protein